MTFKEALQEIRTHKEQIDLAEFANKVGLSERYITCCIDGIIQNQKPFVIPLKFRDRFIDATRTLIKKIFIF